MLSAYSATPAKERVAGGTDVGQRAKQRRCDAWANDQGTQHTHDSNAGIATTTLAITHFAQSCLPAGRQLQFVETEHTQRQQYKHCGKDTQYVGILENHLQIGTGLARDDANHGVSKRHALHIYKGQQKGAAT